PRSTLTPHHVSFVVRCAIIRMGQARVEFGGGETKAGKALFMRISPRGQFLLEKHALWTITYVHDAITHDRAVILTLLWMKPNPTQSYGKENVYLHILDFVINVRSSTRMGTHPNGPADMIHPDGTIPLLQFIQVCFCCRGGNKHANNRIISVD